MPAERAACTPGTESSTTTQSKGCTFMLMAACRKRSGNGFPRGTWLALKMRPSNRSHRPVRPSVKRIFSGEPELATQVSRPAFCKRDDRVLHAGDGLQRRIAKALIGDRLHLLDEVVGQLAAELGLADLHAGLQRQAHQAAHRLLDRPVEALRLERPRKARVGERLAVDQHAVAVEDHQQERPSSVASAREGADVSRVCRPPL